MSDDAVRELARAAGIADEWVDTMGHRQHVGLDSLRRILNALDLPSATAADIVESRHRIQRGSIVGHLPPLVTVPVGTRLSLSVEGIADGACAELISEDGSAETVRLKSRHGGALGPVLRRCGYHRLRLADRELTVAVTPPRCVTLEQRGGSKRKWGVGAQVYGLKRPGDGGIGDATAVRQLAEAAAQRGADAVALSPIHSLFAADPGRYGPYSPSSRLFLNPLYADPAVLFGVERVTQHLSSDASAFEKVRLVDWRPAAEAKYAAFRRLFADFRDKDIAAGTALAADFEQFVHAGGPDLRDHALFEAIHGKRRAQGAKGSWAEWPPGWRHPGGTAIGPYLQAEAGAVRYHQFLQWVTARSFAAAQKAAIDAGMRIGLISDLAIGMDGAGSHAWSRQDDMLPGLTIGAPPDAFNARGQDWGLAGFSPKSLAAKGFEPFLATLRASLRHAGGVRIDHVMGLMRLWLIPEGATPAEGAYVAYPLDDLLRLLALESHRHDAVVIGEDLGTVPPGFRRRLQQAGVAGMDVLWFQRSRSGFKASTRWRNDAVATTSTHDLPTVAGWWRGTDIAVRRNLGLAMPNEEADRAVDRRRLWRALGRAGVTSATSAKPPADDDPDPVVDAALAFVAGSPSGLMLAPVEDMLGLAEQPNLPGTVEEHPNWCRRIEPRADAIFDEPGAGRRADIIARQRA